MTHIIQRCGVDYIRSNNGRVKVRVIKAEYRPGTTHKSLPVHLIDYFRFQDDPIEDEDDSSDEEDETADLLNELNKVSHTFI